jgi:hypothetical protein
MKRAFLTTSAVIAVAISAGISPAAPFTAQLKVKQVTGQCTIREPGAADAVAAEEGKAVPYGSAIKTAAGGEVILSLSDLSVCRLAQKSGAVIEEDAADSKIKRLVLEQGAVFVELEEGFEKHNGFEFKTPTSVIVPTSGKFAVGAAEEQGIVISSVTCEAGQLKINGSYFNLPDVDTGDKLSISFPSDKTWYRIKNVTGKFTVGWLDSEGTPKTTELKDKNMIKIFVVKAEGSSKELRAVYKFGPDSKTVVESWVEAGAAVPGMDVATTGKPESKPETKTSVKTESKTDTDEQDEALLWTEIPSRNGTTTTTVPNPTPVGPR